MNKLLIISLSLIIFCISKLNAQDIFLQSDDNLELSVGEKKVIFYNIVGREQNVYSPNVKIILPEGINLLTSNSTIPSLLIGQHSSLFFTVFADKKLASGKHLIKVKLYGGETFIKELSIPIHVLPNHNISIEPIEKPKYISLEEEIDLKYLLVNNGNLEETISLLSYSAALNGEKSITLKPGESKIVTTKNAFPAIHNSDYVSISFDLRATVPGHPKEFYKIFTVPYLASSNKKNDPYLRFPIEASIEYNTFSASNLESMSAVQYDIRGKGHIDLEKKHEIEFIAHGPNSFDLPRYGQVNQHYFSYSYDGWKIEAGDQNLRLSNLLENSRFARGLQFSKKFDKNRAGAFYVKPRYFQNTKTESGVFFERQVKDNLLVGVNLMNKEHLDRGKALNTNFISLYSFYKTSKITLESEGSLSATNGTISGAISNYAFVDLNKWKFISNTIYTGKSFYGFYNNSLQLSNTINYRFDKKVRLGFSKNVSQLNPSLDEFILTKAPFFDNNTLNVSYLIDRDHRIQLNLISGTREDKMEQQSYHYSEKLARILYYGTFSKLSVQLDGDVGKTKNLLADSENQTFENQWRARTSLFYEPLKGVSASVFAEHLNTKRFEVDQNNGRYWFYGIQSQIALKKNFDFSLSYRNNFAPDELYQMQSFFDVMMNFRHKQHKFSLMANYGYFPDPINEKNVFVSLKYTFSLNAPIKKKKGLGSLSGYVSGVKREGVLLNLNGTKVLTDSSGRYTFYDLVPGKYYLNVNKSSLGFGNVTVENKPFEVLVKPDTVQTFNLTIIKSGQINGKINLRNLKQKTGQNMENHLVEIFNEHHSNVTVTNETGNFSFSELKEGEYKVRLLSKELNQNFHIEETEITVNLTAGGAESIEFNLDEKVKKVKFQPTTLKLIGQ